ncbi:ABC transporter permease [Staphylospora marina]|uniref:ABC transporter permease n=1 Tax=Staphylospora marina TaxID=2490858 RepID=UPI000F5BFEDD|nr:ABC-2 family transporter protein [Staphylospora marina]
MNAWQRPMRSGIKYAAVFRISLKNQLAYVPDFLIRTLFLLVILFVFTQLWSVTFRMSGGPLIEGYSLATMIWYLTVSESIIMSYPYLAQKVEQEVKSGQVAVQLLRPLDYTGNHFAGYVSEFFLRHIVCLFVGGSLTFLMFGPPPVTPKRAGLFLLFLLTALVIQFCLLMSLALLAFWLEETRGMEMIYSRLVMTIGGMMLPLEIFPDWLEPILRWLPFQAVMYLPARILLTETPADWPMLWLGQLGWAAAAFLLLRFVYRLGVKKLDVNGG